MIRYTLLWLFVSGLMLYAWRDWCKSLCVLVLMLAVLERPDMPKQMFGIQGLNPFNVALTGILIAWAAQRYRDRTPWNVPRWLTVFFSLYLAVMALATFRLFRDPSFLLLWQHEAFPITTQGGLIADYLVNTFKWLVPAILMVHGCRGEERQRWLVIGVLGMYFLLALFVMRQMPMQYLLDGEALQQRAADVLRRRVGYHRVDLATMFAGASWAMLAARPLFASRLVRLGLVGMSGITALGLALTAGRMGYGAWCLVGLTLSVLKWRRLLLVAPAAVAMLLVFAPGIPQRMLQGLEGETANDQVVTSGRNLVWPFVLRKISDAPILGFGRQAWARTGLRLDVGIATGEFVGHPHNAYLEFAVDNGLVGLAVLCPLLFFIIWQAARMFRARDDLLANAAGGMALAMTLSYVIAAAGAQTFYPTEGAVGMWCVIALAIRVASDRASAGVPVSAPALPASAIDARALSRPGAVTLWPGSATGQGAPARRMVVRR